MFQILRKGSRQKSHALYSPFILSSFQQSVLRELSCFQNWRDRNSRQLGKKMSSNPQCRLHMRLPLTSLSSCASWPYSLPSLNLPSSTSSTCSSGMEPIALLGTQMNNVFQSLSFRRLKHRDLVRVQVKQCKTI